MAMKTPADQRLATTPSRIVEVDVPVGQTLVYKVFRQKFIPEVDYCSLKADPDQIKLNSIAWWDDNVEYITPTRSCKNKTISWPGRANKVDCRVY